MTRAKVTVLRLLLAIVPPLVLLTTLEGVAYLLHVEPLAASEEYRKFLDYRSYQYGISHPGTYCDPAQVVRPGRTTIITLGGSSVGGFTPSGVDFFPAQLQGLLEEAYPGEYAVVNLGRVAKNSTFVRRCVEHAIRAEPDVIVVYSGHNDYNSWGAENPARAIFWEDHAWIFDVLRVASRSRGFAAATRLFLPAAGHIPMLTEATDEDYEAARPVIVDKYTSNISAIIELAGRRGAQVILVTVVSNLYEFPVRNGEWIGPSIRTPDTERLRRWQADFTLGGDLFRAGRFDDALREFKRARDGRGLGRALSELNDAVRRLARSAPHVHLVDFERQLDRIGKSEGIGCNFFGDATYCDQFHPNERTHRLIAEALFRELRTLHRDPA